MTVMKKFVVSVLIFVSLGVAGVASYSSPAEAYLANCSAWTSGTRGYSRCSSQYPGPPNTTRQAIRVTCVRPWWAGGGSFDTVGAWAYVGQTSIAYCGNYPWKATNPYIYFA